MTEPLLRVSNLEKKFPIQRGMLKRTVGQIHAVDGISVFQDTLPQLHPAVSVALNSTSSHKVTETIKAPVSVTQSMT